MIIPGDRKKVATVIVSKMHGMDKEPEHVNSDDEMATLESIANDLIHAISIKSEHAVALALKAAFECLESEPHQEG